MPEPEKCRQVVINVGRSRRNTGGFPKFGIFEFENRHAGARMASGGWRPRNERGLSGGSERNSPGRRPARPQW